MMDIEPPPGESVNDLKCQVSAVANGSAAEIESVGHHWETDIPYGPHRVRVVDLADETIFSYKSDIHQSHLPVLAKRQR